MVSTTKTKHTAGAAKALATLLWGGIILATINAKPAVWDGKGKRYYDWNTLVDGSNREQLCGKNDWRVPTLYELASLVHCSRGGYALDDGCTGDGYQRPTINPEFFPNTPSSWFWSSSPGANRSIFAWTVYFGDGYDLDGNRGYGIIQVRLVRSSQ